MKSIPTLAALSALPLLITPASADIEITDNLSVKGFLSTLYHDLDTDQSVDFTNLALEEAEIEFDITSGPVSANISIQSKGQDGGKHGVELEQAYAMYNISETFFVSAGKMANVIGFESSEAPKKYQHSAAHLLSNLHGYYNPGVRLGYATEKLQVNVSGYDKIWAEEHKNGELDVAYELSVAVSPLPGLAVSVSYAEDKNSRTEDSTISNRLSDLDDLGVDLSVVNQLGVSEALNFWVSYNVGNMLFAFEYSDLEFGDGTITGDAWLVLANFAFSEKISFTLRYSEEDIGDSSQYSDSNRLTLSPSYAITENLLALIEYSHGSARSDLFGLTTPPTPATEVDFDYIALKGVFTF
jgi:hypothetical protein